jgi:hypothetical protein
MSKGGKTFSNLDQTYGEDRPYPKKRIQKKHEPPMMQEVAFKPSNPAKRVKFHFWLARAIIKLSINSQITKKTLLKSLRER